MMGQVLLHLAKRFFELLFHWTAAGIVLAIWGFTPEHVIAEILRDAPEWITNQLARLPFALVGLGLIAWDIYLRTRRSGGSRYRITHNTDGTSDVEGVLIFPFHTAQMNIKVRLPEFRQKPRITLFPVRRNDS